MGCGKLHWEEYLANMFSLITKKLFYHTRILKQSHESRIGLSRVPCYTHFLFLQVEHAGLIVKGEGLQEQEYCKVLHSMNSDSTQVAFIPLLELPEVCEIEPKQKLLQRAQSFQQENTSTLHTIIYSEGHISFTIKALKNQSPT